MASFKLNIARIGKCPPPRKVARAMEDFALPVGEEFGVLQFTSTDQSVAGTIIRRTQQAVQRVDEESREVTTAAVERVTVYPFAVRPDAEILEVYAGSAAGLEQVGIFFSTCLAMPVEIETIELDIGAAIDKLSAHTQKFQLRSVRVSEYAHNSYMSGPYAPKFLDSEQGKKFLEEYAQFAKAASARFSGPTGKVNVTLSPQACFGFSCNEDDQPTVQSVLRKLI